MNINIGANYFPNQGFWIHQFTDEELKPLRDEIDRMHENPKNFRDYRKDLAGNIAGSLGVSQPVINYLEGLILPVAESYDREFEYVKKVKSHLNRGKLTMSNQCWVNFQRACEFNPVHNHSGVFSWVIWLEIPYLAAEQQSSSPGYLSNTPVAGSFEFNYTGSLGDQYQFHIDADATYRNRMALFPSRLNHGVYPFFNSDQVRISASGNFLFE